MRPVFPSLPCSDFITVLASKKHAKYLPFENKGIQPDVTLDMKSGWLLQMQKYHENNE